MAKQIARLLKTNMMADIDMPALAQFLQSQGRRGDSVLAHINPKEAMLLQKMGGAGTENPATGLPEFYQPDTFGRNFGEDFVDTYYDSYMSRQRPMEEAQRLSDLASSSSGDGSQTITVPDYGINRSRGFRGSAMQDAGMNFDTNVSSKTGVPTREEFNRQFPGGTPEFTDAGYLGDPSLATQFTPGAFSGNLGLEVAGRRYDDGSYMGAGITPRYISSNLSLSPVPENISRIPSEFATRPDLPEELAAVDNRNIFRRGIDSLKEITGLSGEELARLGLAGGLGIQGALSARQMAEQGQEARREQEAIAAPYRERGAALLSQAEGGQLTPQAQQSLQAMRARLQQGVESRGGVGAQQAAAQVEAFRQQLLGNQFDYGMKISNIGDQIAMGAIRTGLEADRYASQMTNKYFTNMAKLLAGMGEEEKNPVTQQSQVRGVK